MTFSISSSAGSQFDLRLQTSRHSWPPARYKYLQRPLESSSLPTLLQYVHRWTTAQTEKLAIAVGLLISQGLASAGCLLSLNKDHLVKNGMQFLVNALVSDSSLSVDRCICQRYHPYLPCLFNRPVNGSSFRYSQAWGRQGLTCFLPSK